MRGLIFIVLFLPAGISLSYGQTGSDTTHRHRIGIGAGFTTGMGLSYRYLPNQFGVQVNFAPIVTDQMCTVSAGITFLYYLIPGRVASLYMYQGNHFYYHTETTYYTDATRFMVSSDKTDIYEKRKEEYWNNGIGFGIELQFAERVSFNMMAGYASYVNFSQINVTGEAALYFKF